MFNTHEIASATLQYLPKSSGQKVADVMQILYGNLTVKQFWLQASLNPDYTKGCSRIYPGGGTFFSDPSTPRTHMESEPPRLPGHISALINPTPLWIKYALTPRTSYPHSPTSRTRYQQNTSPHRTKKCLRPTPPE